MTHQEIEAGETIERYVRHRLPPDERRAFQEHYFNCEECFEQVQMTARLIAGVRQASRRGLGQTGTEPASFWATLFRPGFVLGAAATLVVGIGVAWFMFNQISSPQQEVARVSQPASPSAIPAENPTENSASPKPPDEPPLLAQNEIPSVLLESSRDAGPKGAPANELTLPAGARTAVFRLEVEPDSPFASFQCQVYDPQKRLVATGTSGKASAGGAVAARVPAQELQSGDYRVECYGLRNGQRELIGEYDLHVRKL